ncbi:MAG: gfo/Idh/MocA family oxidoreductase [Candidatus Latescibacterota bacterium]|nr:MAG: gfo/Idh/MocA family oxidoreductase [Candidatus Latescibacterota bacterium]RKY73554.1 MAG: gfo/Idh/MocA family oxidoreductase [Candidatus Latescibacterota bacterium]
MERTIGFGIIGCGTIAPWHADSVARIEGARLVAVSDVVEEAARKMGQKYQANWYTDYQKILEREDVDVVCVLTPSGMRKEIVLKAAEAGKHVVVEKPIEVTLERIDQMIGACEQAGVKLAVIFQNRFLPGPRRVKEAMEEGKLGKPILGDAYIKWYRTQQYYDSGGWRGTWRYDGGGALMNQSIHTIDLLLWIMGPVHSVSAKMATLAHKIEVEDLAVATLRFASGALGVIEGSTALYPGFASRLEIHGENGSLILKGEQVVAWELKDGEQIPLPFPPQKAAAGGQADPTKISAEGHYLQLKDMVEAVRANREPLVNGKEGRKAVELIRAIYQSAESGEEVCLPL